MASWPSNESTGAATGDPVRVLLIDDEADTLFPLLAQELESSGFEFHKESSPDRALDSVQLINPEVVLLDLHFPGDDRRGGKTTGGRLLTQIRGRFPAVAVVVFTTRLDDVDIPEEAFEAQPHFTFAKPKFGRDLAWVDSLAAAMRDAIDTAQYLCDPNEFNPGFLVGQTPAMRHVAGLIRSAAHNVMTVLIYGETGTGKQLAAEAIHKLSGRTGRFEHFNCSGVHEETLEATLFGYESGAFSGARKTGMPGLFELANGGTLFLDEIQRMPVALQDKLMLVIEHKRVRRMGATKDTIVDVRLIAATNHNLSDLVDEGAIREDLAQRLSRLPIILPPLRARMEDIPDFFNIFIAKANSALGKHVLDTLRPEVLEKFVAYDWRGNIRELESTIERAVATTRSNVLLSGDIEFAPVGRRVVAQTAPGSPDVATPAPPTEVEAVDADTAVSAVVETLTNQLESLSLDKRYAFLLGQGAHLQEQILVEFIRRLRAKTHRKVGHKVLAAALDPLSRGDTDLARIRQFVCGHLKLTELDFNQ